RRSFLVCPRTQTPWFDSGPFACVHFLLSAFYGYLRPCTRSLPAQPPGSAARWRVSMPAWSRAPTVLRNASALSTCPPEAPTPAHVGLWGLRGLRAPAPGRREGGSASGTSSPQRARGRRLQRPHGPQRAARSTTPAEARHPPVALRPTA